MSPVPPAMSRMASAGARLHPAHEAIFPQPVHAARHGIIHQIVAACHAPEDIADTTGLLFGFDILIAKGNLAHKPPLAKACCRGKSNLAIAHA